MAPETHQKPNALEAWSRTKRSSLPVALWTRLQQRAFLTQDFNEPSKGLGLAEKKKKNSEKPSSPNFPLINKTGSHQREPAVEPSTREAGQGRERRPSKSRPPGRDRVKYAFLRLCVSRGFRHFCPHSCTRHEKGTSLNVRVLLSKILPKIPTPFPQTAIADLMPLMGFFSQNLDSAF